MSAEHSPGDTDDVRRVARRSNSSSAAWDYSWGGVVTRIADFATGLSRDEPPRVQAIPSQDESSASMEAGVRQADDRQEQSAQSLGGTILRHLSGRSQEGTTSTSSGEETTAGAAERHRLTGRTLGIDQQSLTHWSEANAPFVFILLCVFLFQHFIGILVFGYLTLMLAASNDFIQEQNSLKEGRKILSLIGCILGLAGHLPAIIFVSQGCLSWRAFLLFVPATVPSIWDCLYCVTTADFFIRVCGSILKMLFLLRSKGVLEDGFRRRRQLLTMVEHWVLFYRACISSPFWFVLLYSGGFVSSIFTGAYLATKCAFIYKRFTALLASLKMVWRCDAQHGKYVTQEELLELGTSCPICQDAMIKPIMLNCRHAYCDSCIQEWLERGENTCPLCRAAILPAGLQFFGNGATTLLPQLF